MINEAYGSAPMIRANVYWWYARFQGGRTWRVMPEVVVIRLPEQKKTWYLLVVGWQDRHTSVKVIADGLNIGTVTVQ